MVVQLLELKFRIFLQILTQFLTGVTSVSAAPIEGALPTHTILFTVRAPLLSAHTYRPLSYYIRTKHHLKNKFCNISLSQPTSRVPKRFKMFLKIK